MYVYKKNKRILYIYAMIILGVDMKKEKWVSTIKIILIVLAVIVFSLTIVAIIIERSKIQFSLLGKNEVTLEVGEKYIELGFIATLRKNDISKRVNVKSNVDTNKVGDYTINYNLGIIYLYFNKTLVRKVHVVDTKKPELTIQGDKQVKLYVGDSFEYPVYSATDNYDGEITNNVKMTSNLDTNKIGVYEVNYSVSDSSNNVSEEKIVINVVERKKDPYIKVSISKQTLYYYEYDKLVLETSVVTGKNSTPTPKGDFRVISKAKNVNLKGSDYVSFVNYWIAFIGHSYGMHDASWRNSFGGTIYKNSGSHGCINMPTDKVKQLYELVDIGTPVYVYD